MLKETWYAPFMRANVKGLMLKETWYAPFMRANVELFCMGWSTKKGLMLKES